MRVVFLQIRNTERKKPVVVGLGQGPCTWLRMLCMSCIFIDTHCGVQDPRPDWGCTINYNNINVILLFFRSATYGCGGNHSLLLLSWSGQDHNDYQPQVRKYYYYYVHVSRVDCVFVHTVFLLKIRQSSSNIFIFMLNIPSTCAFYSHLYVRVMTFVEN